MTRFGMHSRGDKLTGDDAMRFGAILRLWREVNDIAGATLAKELWTDKFMLSRIENGAYQLPVATAIRIAEHIGLDLDGESFEYRGYRLTLARIEPQKEWWEE